MPPKVYYSVNTFNAGEVSELIFNREDISKYRSACLTLENAFPLVEGGAKKMPGTYFAGSTKNNAVSRLVPFQFSTLQGAILEFSDKLIRIWEPSAPGVWDLGLALSSSVPIELVTPYTEADLFNLDCGTQSADVLWIFHPSYPPACVERHSATSWEYTTIPPGVSTIVANNPAYRGTADIISQGFSGIGSSILQLTQAFPLIMITDRPFSYGDRVYINSCAGMVEVNESEFFVTPVLNNGDLAAFNGRVNNGGGDHDTFGTVLEVVSVSSGTIQVGMAINGPNVTPNTVITADLGGGGGVGNYQVNIQQNVPTEDLSALAGNAYNLVKVDDGALFVGSISGTVLTVTAMAAGHIYAPMALFWQGVPNGLAVISFGTGTGGVGTYNLNMSLTLAEQQISSVPVVSTDFLSYQGGGFVVKVIPVFDAANKYPACGTFYQGRLYVAGANNTPNRINGSVIGDFPNFICDPNADDYGLQFDLLSTLLDQVISMIGTPTALLLGTAGGVWTVTGSAGSTVSQTNLTALKQGVLGVSQLAPQLVGDSAVFVSRSARQVMFLVFNFVTNEWSGYDLTRLNRQITIGSDESGSGIVQTAFQAEPYPILWAARADGQLIGLVFNRQDEVYAWFRVNMLPEGGAIESVAVISGQNEEDMIAVVVNRTINGSTVRYVEYFYPQELFNDLSNAFFVHCGLQLNLGASVAITNITQANPPVVTAAGHNYANGAFVQISGVLGMVQINQSKMEAYTVANSNPGAGTFELADMDTTGFDPYVGGGQALGVTNQVTGMSYLLGQEVTAVGDCALILPPTTVTSDTVTFDYYCAQITIGLPYTMTVRPVNPVVSSPTATTHGMKQKLSRVTISLYQSLGGEYGVDLDHMYPITYGPGTKGQQP